MRSMYSKFVYSFSVICIVMAFLSCSKDKFGDEMNDFSKSNSEFEHTVSIDDAENI